MKITSALFLQSNTDYKKCPSTAEAEFAFIGRSNVGKSSLINMLVNKKGLAKTSGTPGKTQMINHFKINDKWFIADLPGYGFAKASREKSAKWQKMIYDYLKFRENLTTIFVLIDSRLEPQKNDLNFINQLGAAQIPFALVFTKADKQSSSKTRQSADKFCAVLLEEWESLPPHFFTSAATGAGREKILLYIEEAMAQYAAKAG